MPESTRSEAQLEKETLPQDKLCESSTESAVPVLLGTQCEGAFGWLCLSGLTHAQSSTGHAGSPAVLRAPSPAGGTT